MQIRAQQGPDRPALGTLGAVTAGGLVLGLLLARSAVGVPPPPSSPGGPEGVLEDPASATVEPEPGPTDPATVPEGRESAPHALAGAATASPPDVDALEPPSAGTPGPSVAREPEPPPEPAAGGTPAPSAAPSPPAWTRLVHGRVAYLRCEGIPAPEGASPSDAASGCPRDRALEERVWTAVDALGECSAGPLGVGEADLVVELRADAPPEVRTRDRFAPDVVRLDGAAIATCLSGALSTAASSLGATRLVVSFRFRAVP